MIRLPSSRHLFFALSPLLLLGACGKASAPQAGPTASGEILPGSVSDAMLDTDRSQAQAPLAPAAHSAATKSDPSTPTDASAAAADTAVPADAGPTDPAAPQAKPQTSNKPATP